MINARHMPNAAMSNMMANGKALVTAAVCSAANPPANSSTEATTPSILAQNTRCHTGVSSTPPEASESTTKEPESEEVTKKVMIKMTVAIEIIIVKKSGQSANKYEYIRNRATASS